LSSERGPRLVPSAVLGSRRGRRFVREDDRSARALRRCVRQFSIHRRTAGQPALGQAGAHGELAGSLSLV